MSDIVTADDVKAWLGIGDFRDDANLTVAAAAANQQTRSYCGRSFTVDAAQSATARYFTPVNGELCWIDDAWSVTAVATDDNDDGAWSTSWSASDYTLDPLDTVGPNGLTGWPYTRIRAVESRTFPWVGRPAVKVTAKWGWSALPDDVKTATLMIAAEIYKAKAGGFEVMTADGSFVPMRRNMIVRDLLAPYRTMRANDARFVLG